LTELVPAPDEPVMEMIGCLTDIGANRKASANRTRGLRRRPRNGGAQPASRMAEAQRKGSCSR
jgi:hypothetical protein